MSIFTERAVALVENCGGEVSEKMFVERPGVMVLSTAEGVHKSAMQLFDRVNIWNGQSDEDRLAEFIARITYLSFPKDSTQAEAQSKGLQGLLKTAGHTSPYEVASLRPNVLVAGISIETMLEIIANKYAIGRVCSSRTDAMTEPLFRIPNAPPALQQKIRSYVRQVVAAHRLFREDVQDDDCVGLSSKDRKELINMGHTGYKAGHLVIAADPEFWNNKLARRLKDNPDGVELELRFVLAQIADVLHEACPEINSSSTYA